MVIFVLIIKFNLEKYRNGKNGPSTPIIQNNEFTKPLFGVLMKKWLLKKSWGIKFLKSKSASLAEADFQNA